MEIDFDPVKSLKNAIERQLPFDRVIDFEWDTAIYWEDTRLEYTEQRIVAIAFLNNRLHTLCFTPIKNGIRVISFRKSNKRERKRYEETDETETKAANEPRW